MNIYTLIFFIMWDEKEFKCIHSKYILLAFCVGPLTKHGNLVNDDGCECVYINIF